MRSRKAFSELQNLLDPHDKLKSTVMKFHSFRTKLQVFFVLLGLAAIGATGWETSAGAASALRQATFDRLTAVSETRGRQLERYFKDLNSHVVALSTDESTITALQGFEKAWVNLPAWDDTSLRQDDLRRLYQDEFGQQSVLINKWFPRDPRTRVLQYLYLAKNPHSRGGRDLLLNVPQAGAYGDVHSRFHPIFHRYKEAFGFYDILLISAREGRIHYSVLKELDLGTSLEAEPMRTTHLARIFKRALALPESADAVIEDYAPYLPSNLAPAAFAAAPIRKAGTNVGVLAIQVSIAEVNRVMTGDGTWAQDGLGRTGQSYAVGPDLFLRSDLRPKEAEPAENVQTRTGAGRTAVLNISVGQEVAHGKRATTTGVGFHGIPVLRSQAPVHYEGLHWTVVSEIDSREALAPVVALQYRVLRIGIVIAALFFLAAGWLARSVTQPVVSLAENVGRLGHNTLGLQVPVESSDEVGRLTVAFNRMSEDLRQTTVSKAELEVLAGRLISAQEKERSRIARELHDDLTQRLAAVAIEAGRLEKLPEASGNDLRAGYGRLKQQMARIAEDIHGLSRRLHPAILDDLGLKAAVEAECRGIFERGGPFVDFASEGDWSQVSRDAQLALYRIVQESLRNVQRHSGATEVVLKLRAGEGMVSAEIRDNGRGFDRLAPGWRPGLGLASMEERAHLLNGTFHVTSAVGQGTTVRVSLPEKSADAKT